MAEAGMDVTFLVREKRKQKLEKTGLVSNTAIVTASSPGNTNDVTDQSDDGNDLDGNTIDGTQHCKYDDDKENGMNTDGVTCTGKGVVI